MMKCGLVKCSFVSSKVSFKMRDEEFSFAESVVEEKT